MSASTPKGGERGEARPENDEGSFRTPAMAPIGEHELHVSEPQPFRAGALFITPSDQPKDAEPRTAPRNASMASPRQEAQASAIAAAGERDRVGEDAGLQVDPRGDQKKSHGGREEREVGRGPEAEGEDAVEQGREDFDGRVLTERRTPQWRHLAQHRPGEDGNQLKAPRRCPQASQAEGGHTTERPAAPRSMATFRNDPTKSPTKAAQSVKKSSGGHGVVPPSEGPRHLPLTQFRVAVPEALAVAGARERGLGCDEVGFDQFRTSGRPSRIP